MALSPRAQQVLSPLSLTSPGDVRTAPRDKGVYAWWFTRGALAVPAREYAMVDGRELLYVGIAPQRPSATGQESKSCLRARLLTHATRHASRSTLRLTLGSLLVDKLGLELGMHARRASWGSRGESDLTRWMGEHARVNWVVDEEPWVIEDELLVGAPLALNVDGRRDAFAVSLSARRKELRRAAREADSRP